MFVGKERTYYQELNDSASSQKHKATDFILIVDDSASMSTEQDWIAQAALALDERLNARSIGTGEKKNHFFVVIFGIINHDVDDWLLYRVEIFNNSYARFSAKSVETAAKTAFKKKGNAEDGYEAIEKALAMPELRSDDPEVALNIALITDEPRDPCSRPRGGDPPGTESSREDILRQLLNKTAKLNVMANIRLRLNEDTAETDRVIAVDYKGTVFRRNGVTPPEQFENVGFEASYTSCKSFLDYGYLAMRTQGAVWNLNLVDETADDDQLRTTFTSDVARIKVEEIVSGPQCQECRITCNEDGSETTVCTTEVDSFFCTCRAGDKSVSRLNVGYIDFYCSGFAGRRLQTSTKRNRHRENVDGRHVYGHV